MTLSNKYLTDLVEEYEKLKIYLAKITTDLSDEKFNTKPDEKSWSVAECISHLNITYEVYKPTLIKAIEENKNINYSSIDVFKTTFLKKKFIELLEPPYKLKMKTFKNLQPNEKLNKTEVERNFNKLTDEFISFIVQCEKVDLKNTVIVSPESSLVKFQMGEVFPFLSAHARRHLWQAEYVINRISD